jgi:hypothetical protein
MHEALSLISSTATLHPPPQKIRISKSFQIRNKGWGTLVKTLKIKEKHRNLQLHYTEYDSLVINVRTA